MSGNSYRVAIAGLGTVGLGLVDLLTQNADLISARAGRHVQIMAVNARDKAKDRGIDLSGFDWEDDPLSFTARDDVDCVIELIGGEGGVALDLARATIAAGKDFVTANKAMLALHGAELAEAAENAGVTLAYEAAVAGAVPIIKTLRESLGGNRVSKIGGILNGTCNFILSKMESTGAAYGEVLKEAQDLGYAEADPTTDVGGFDAAHKLCLVSSIAFGRAPDFGSVVVRGIDTVTDKAIEYAGSLGYRIRLLGVATADKMIVAPMAVPKDGLMASVTGADNAIQIKCDQAREIFLRGPGAGRSETASAVAADIMDSARGQRVQTFGLPVSALAATGGLTASTDGDEAPYFLMLQVQDEPGVMANIMSIMADRGISVDKLSQPGGKDGMVDIVIVTYQVSEEVMSAARRIINTQPFVLGTAVAFPIERFED